MKIEVEKEEYLACVTELPEEKSKVIFYPLDRVLLLNPDSKTNRPLPNNWKPISVNGLEGHPRIDIKDETILESISTQKRSFIERSINNGYIIIIKLNMGGSTRISRIHIDKLGLSEHEINWLKLYCEFTTSYKEMESKKNE